MALGFNIYPGNLELFALTQVASWSTTNRTAQREEFVDFLFSGAGWAVNCSWNCLNIQGRFGTVRASDGKGPSGGECVDKHATAMAEYHTGYRAFTKEVLQAVPYERNSDDFVFDNQMLAQIFYLGFSIGEVSCPTKYFEEASSINLRRSITYGWGVLGVSLAYRLQKMRLANFKLFRS